jgi:AcrR family transcriptional regulator
MRQVAEAAQVSLGTVQFRFPSLNDLARQVLRAWAEEVSRGLDEAVGDACGLSRTWKICEWWVTHSTGEVVVALEALQIDAGRSERGGARDVALESMRRWIDGTRRSLRQAQLRHELKPAVDIRSVAIEIHRLLWSHTWTSALYGPEASAHSVLGTIWHRLSAVAADPSGTLPPFERILSEPAIQQIQETATEESEADPFATWKLLLNRTDPLYHAFERHETMGDPRNFAYPPDVTPDDIARAEEFSREHGSRTAT